MKRAKTHLPPKPRNPVARSPLMRKGGAHGKSMAAKRRQENVLLAKAKRELGFKARPAIEALADAVTWFRGKGMVP